MTEEEGVRLGRLSAEQLRLLPAVRDEWLAIGAATGPADREQALDGVRAAYRRAGLPVPSRVMWFDSPLAAAVAMWRANLASPVADVIGRAQNRFNHWEKGWAWQPTLDQIRRDVSIPLGHHDKRWRDLIGEEINDQMASTPLDALVDRLRVPQYGKVRKKRVEFAPSSVALPYPTWGQHDVSALGTQEVFARLGVDGAGPPADLVRVAQYAGWWWPFKGTVVLTERPTALARDEHGYAHSPDGPAVSYPDGFAVYAWRGVRVPPRVITGELTGADWLNEENSQVRQAIAERMGYQWMLANVPAEQLDKDRHGTLWRIREHETPYSLSSSSVDPEDIWLVELTRDIPVREQPARGAAAQRRVWRVEPGLPAAKDAAGWIRRSAKDYRPRRPNTYGLPPKTPQKRASQHRRPVAPVSLTASEHVGVVAFGEVDGYPIVASDAADGGLVLWDPRQPHRLSNLRGRSGDVTALAFGTVGGRPVLASGANRTVELWDLAERSPLATVTVDDEKVIDVALAGHLAGRDVLAIASGSAGRSWQQRGRVDLWDAATGEHLRTLHRGDEEDVRALAVVEVGDRIALVAAYWFTLRMWDVATGEQLRTWDAEQTGAASRSCEGAPFCEFTEPLLGGVVAGRRVLGAVMKEFCGGDSHGPEHDEFLVVYWDVETSDEVSRCDFETNERPVASVTVGGTSLLATATETWLYHLRRTRVRVYRFPQWPVADFSTTTDVGGVRSASFGMVDGSLRLATTHARGPALLWDVPLPAPTSRASK